MVFNLKPTRTSNVEVEGEKGKSPVPGHLTAVRKSLEKGRGRSRRKAEATGLGVSGIFAPADVVGDFTGDGGQSDEADDGHMPSAMGRDRPQTPRKKPLFWGWKGGFAEPLVTRNFLYSMMTFLSCAPLA